MRLVYCLVYYLCIPLILLRQLWRARFDRRHLARLPERFGFVRPLTGEHQQLWIHTVSVGEFLGALPLIQRLLARENCELIVTSMTLTGSERIRHALGDRVQHFYMPYDLPGAVRRFIRRVDPDLLVIMETELWPNTLAACRELGVPSLLVNARLSERSARGYARLPGFTAEMLSDLSRAAVQQRADAERFHALGLAQDKTQVTGNIKFDIEIGGELRSQAAVLKSQWSVGGRRLIWMVASTHAGEDEIILETLTKLRRAGIDAGRLLLALVPRHPERFERVAALIAERGFTLERRSGGATPPPGVDVLLGDTMGEMKLLFGASDIVFMGGSLVDVGGHNFIEPAVWARPLLSGPVLHNFTEVSKLLIEAGALQVVQGSEDLATALQALVEDESLRLAGGRAALQVAEANRGALDRTLGVIDSMLQP
ncbi:lipid IV(A) 3-deoxy-D-manno-octulosonic acid transferase [Gilvimarinus algae]|uniref:3-deoxy-D-manno-octulosonic acid transferase n=1 Tax=Gilvimarinus algae TaxID=3058037 RepID=A0ABT8TCM3_9GAMM|nr:lipid IV(A) 3-deoxy-D-manno-octulosonic acid transferase [Gilvimarinus sp. SDUM040014]MDO3380878.1 lipid IV(A) 3-deoxy-D-manno-octulosonic acid transferase [Gilvimarinus sp. SDUM040014]